MQRRCVLVFLKYPTPGRVKTRLAATLGDEAAVEIYRRLVDRVLHNLSAAPLDEIRVMFDPPSHDAEAKIREWLAPALAAVPAQVTISFVAQFQGDLGERLAAGFSQAFADGGSQVMAIGTDCVAIDEQVVAAAWQALDRCDAVFGPTEDGGYYLLATRSLQPALFENIPWSSEVTLARSLQQAEQSGLAVEQLTTLADVDDAGDWQRARAGFFPDLDAERS